MSDQTSVSPATSPTTVSTATVSTARAADGPGALRLIGLAAVGVGLAALAGAAFVLSYGGIHAFALEAGISPRLARGYPLIFDVLLVVILAAVLALRGAGLPSKVLAWVCLLGLLSAAAGADALHAAGRKLPAQSAAVTAAIVPWALVLIALALLLAMLRHARLRRLAGSRVTGRGEAQPQWKPSPPPPAPSLPLIPGFGPDEPAAQAWPSGTAPGVEPPALEVSRPVIPRQVTAEFAADTAGPFDSDQYSRGGPPETDLAIDTELVPDDPSSDETPFAPFTPAAQTAPGELGPDETGDHAALDHAALDHAAFDHAALDHAAFHGAGADEAEDQSGEQDFDGPGDSASEDPAGEDPAGEDPVSDGPDSEDPASDSSETVETADPEMPVFHRMWSSPVPPAGE